MSVKQSVATIGKILLMALGALFVIGVAANLTIEQPNSDKTLAERIASQEQQRVPYDVNNGAATIVKVYAQDNVLVKHMRSDRSLQGIDDQRLIDKFTIGIEHAYCNNFAHTPLRAKGVLFDQDGDRVGETDIIGPDDC